jgi:hypothetical protein
MMPKKSAESIAQVLMDAWNDDRIKGTSDIVSLLRKETMTPDQKKRLENKIEEAKKRVGDLEALRP